MDIIVRGKHWDVPDDLAQRARRKLGRLDRYLPLLKDATVEVDFAYERTKQPERRYLVRASVSGGGVHLRGEERAAKPEAAVDLLASALESQARRHKQKLYERGRTRVPKEMAARRAAPAVGNPGPDEEGVLAKVASVEHLAVKPMTTEEAIEQIEVLGRDFFLFHDVDVGRFSLLYRRDGGYGLVIPELP